MQEVAGKTILTIFNLYMYIITLVLLSSIADGADAYTCILEMMIEINDGKVAILLDEFWIY